MTQARRWRLRGALELVFAGDGDAYLVRGGSGSEHVVRSPSPEDRKLLEALAAGDVVLDDGSEAAARVRPLILAGAVVEQPDLHLLDGDDAERFDRQLPYLEDFGDPVALQRRLRGSTIAVIGCGGLGSWATAALACAGVGRFVLVDDDHVALSNLNRQVLFASRDVGSIKVDRTEAWLRAFDDAIAVETHRRRIRGPDDLEVLAHCDAWVLTADWPPYDLLRWVGAASGALQVPFTTAGQQPPVVRVGPTFIPGRGPCVTCYESRMREQFPLYDDFAAHRQSHPPSSMTLGPTSAVVGALLASEVMHLLLGVGDLATFARAILLDTRTMQTTSETVDVTPACPDCGG